MLIATIRLGIVIVFFVNDRLLCEARILFLLSLRLLSSLRRVKPPVKISFLSGVAGRVADLLIAGRDAVLLAVEKHTSPAQLMKSLPEIGPFSGLPPKLKSNKFGDVEKMLFLTVVGDDLFRGVE